MTPEQAEGCHRQGLIAAQAGRLDEALDLIAQAIAARPGVAAWWAHYGLVLESAGDALGAVQAYAGALNLDGGPDGGPDGGGLAIAGNGLLVVLRGLCGAAPAALAEGCLRRALVLDPAWAELWGLHATHALLAQGRPAEAQAGVERALRLEPDADSLHGARLFLMQHDPGRTMAQVAQAHADWGARHPDRPAPAVAPPAPKLRIGYVLPHFRAHPAGSVLEPVLAAHDRDAVEAVCYADAAHPRGTTGRLKARADAWVETAGMSDDALLARIRADNIHILVDMAGHGPGNRLGVFARRAAPVQVTWAGYAGTTGLPAMDYLISDHRLSPEGADGWAIEGIVRMPDAHVPWEPPEDAPAVAPLPMLERGHPTFGSFNALSSLNPAVAALWARVLAAVPGARLMLRAAGLEEAGQRARTAALFIAAGLDPARFDLRGGESQQDVLAGYGAVDVALDPFPCSGGVTTLEALWMGVPVVTLGSDRFGARRAAAHLASAGLSALAVGDADAYVAMAAALVSDSMALAGLRAGLRDRLTTSPALDGVRFTRALEAAFGAMWQRAAAGQGRASFSFDLG
ncbi:putative O-linked N-acetylglucosamine transferase (SPINDLY family) [Azospirillum agricola]|uniref:O-linked N-acetylglucosamine transferase, SPINDLY family protein n=1 Tax=Azospirillum agricola TaxID=1720247 RepID=UPI001AE4863F|nr:glycosyltransferase family 41 protein [Azospirillum agricola]MBP2230579.1 putative O-linked N-acetylglucosamine transferase (SPINDLY family) [Azospirillum agricola]